jgi:hypothetical protein
MKKLAVVLGTALLAIGTAVRADTINAPYCVDFTQFCDGLEITALGGGQVAGYWRNTDCAGTDVKVGGRINEGSISVYCSDAACPIGFLWMFTLSLPTHAFTLIGWDGVNPPIPFQVNAPFSIAPGACSFSEKTGVPSSLAR